VGESECVCVTECLCAYRVVFDHCVESGLINRQMQEVRGMRAVFVGIKSSVLTLCSWKAQ
jgi:hypothetical protein